MSAGIGALLQVLAQGSATETSLQVAQLQQQFQQQEQDSILANGLPPGFTTGISPLGLGAGSISGSGIGGLLPQAQAAAGGSPLQGIEQLLAQMEQVMTGLTGQQGASPLGAASPLSIQGAQSLGVGNTAAAPGNAAGSTPGCA